MMNNNTNMNLHNFSLTPNSPDSFLLNFGHINIKGLSSPTKQQSLIHLFLRHKLHLLALTETKLSSQTSSHIYKPESSQYSFSSWWSSHSLSHQKAGVGILLHRSLATYVQKSTKWNGRLLALDLYVKQHRWKIIVAYIPPYTPDNKAEIIETFSILTTWLDEVRSKNFECILLGDLNARYEEYTAHIAHHASIPFP